MRIAAIAREIPAVLKELVTTPALRTVALIVLPYAFFCIGLDVASRYGDMTGQALPVQFFLSEDRGFGEYLEYSCFLASALMMVLMWRRERSATYLVNAVLFVYLAADDAFEFHEQFGFLIAPQLAKILPAGLPIEAHYLGEPVLFGMVGLAWFVALLFALRDARVRPIIHSLIVIGCIAATAFFGVFLDTLTDWGPHTQAATDIAAFLEDGGEFVCIVITLFFVSAMYDVEKRRARAMLADDTLVELPLAA